MNAVITEVDTTIGRTTNKGPRITRTWHCGEFTIRARIAHDSYRQQSYAVAEVLTPTLTWTEICETAAEEFHWSPGQRPASKVTKEPTETDLLDLAGDLMHRACRILRVPGAADSGTATARTRSRAAR